MTDRIALWVGVGLLVGLSVPGGQGQGPKQPAEKGPDPKTVKALMQRKLEHSQKILEGLAMNDLPKASAHAEELIKIRKEAGWKIFKTREYEKWSDEFDQSAQNMIKAAKDKNLESAKLSYMEMTFACFNCHTYVRDMGRIDFEDRTGRERAALLFRGKSR